MGGVEVVLLTVLYIIAIASIVASAAYAYYTYYNQKKLFSLMETMLDRAINNDFSADNYSETRLSRLEQKLERFIIMSKSSRKSVAEERDKIKSLISDISHQTKTPVSNILLYSQLLKSRMKQNEQTYVMINELINQTEKLNFLIQSFIKMSRLETGVIKLNSSENFIYELLLNIINDVEACAKDKEIAIDICCGKELCARFDPKWTREAIFNIVDNSIKYTGKNGNIKIAVKRYEFFYRIDISDTGIGINENEFSKIFTRFYRSPSVSHYEGVGIGLYIAREIIMAQGGYIKVSSANMKGAVFSVFLPTETDG